MRQTSKWEAEIALLMFECTFEAGEELHVASAFLS